VKKCICWCLSIITLYMFRCFGNWIWKIVVRAISVLIFIFPTSQAMYVQGCWKSPYPDQEGNKLQRQKILCFIYPIYNHNWRNISNIYIYKTRLASNEIFQPSNKIHREVVRAKDLSAPLYNDIVQPLLQWKSGTYYIFWECICSIRYPVCNAHAPYCHLWRVPL